MLGHGVTGATGFVGSHVSEALLTAGDEVVAVDSFTACYDPALAKLVYEHPARARVRLQLRARGGVGMRVG